MLRFALLLGLAGCVAGRPPVATAIDAQRANVPLATLETGRTLVIKKCGGCHATPMPSDHTAMEWPKSLDEMAGRANLANDERRAIEQYMLAMLR